jgi:hypothetical protein
MLPPDLAGPVQHGAQVMAERSGIPFTQIAFPVAEIGALPPDLLAGFNGAVFCAAVADGIKQIYQMPPADGMRDILTMNIEHLQRDRNDCREAILAVVNELIGDQPVRFGDIQEASAHMAAVRFADRVIDEIKHALLSPQCLNRDPEQYFAFHRDFERPMDLGFVEKHYDVVADHFHALALPDGQDILIAIKLEAVKAARRREIMVAREPLEAKRPNWDSNVINPLEIAEPIVNVLKQLQRNNETSDELQANQGKGSAICMIAGGFVYRTHKEDLAGKPWGVLNAFVKSTTKRMTATDLLKSQTGIWSEDSVATAENVKDAIEDVRAALRRALGAAKVENGPRDPILCVDRAANLAWELRMP